MDPQLEQRLNTLEAKIDAVYVSTEKTRKYFLGVIVASVVAFVLPLLGLVFAIPTFLSTFDALNSMAF